VPAADSRPSAVGSSAPTHVLQLARAAGCLFHARTARRFYCAWHGGVINAAARQGTDRHARRAGGRGRIHLLLGCARGLMDRMQLGRRRHTSLLWAKSICKGISSRGTHFGRSKYPFSSRGGRSTYHFCPRVRLYLRVAPAGRRISAFASIYEVSKEQNKEINKIIVITFNFFKINMKIR
jgi:hypothetical protein